MENILKEFKSRNLNNLSCGCWEEISLITYLATLTQDEITSNEMEAASNILHSALKNLYKDHYNVIKNILNDEKPYILIENSGTFNIFVRDAWLFRTILINSLKHSNIINNSLDKTYDDLLTSVIRHIVKTIDIVKPLSLHLLRTLFLIINKRRDILRPNLNRLILNCMNRVAASPMTVFRQYAREISKQVVSSLPNENTAFQDISLLPLRGIDMCDIVKRFSKTFVIQNHCDIIKKLLSMFLRNVESKEGGALYECLLFYSFDEWKRELWPIFLEYLRDIDYEGEFFQSLLKYWITMNVNTYRNAFYNFLRTEPIDWKLKCYILLESKRKGYTLDDDIMNRDILTAFYNLETRGLALKLATTYHKKSVWPTNYEIDTVMNYLYSNTNISLEEEESRSLRNFFSQIFLHAHTELKKDAENIRCTSIVESIYVYCCSTLKTDYFEVGCEIAFILWTVATGSSKDLVLSYRLEKRDSYTNGENLFYARLKENNMWWFGSEKFQQELIYCFHKTNGSSTYITRLFTKYLDIPVADMIDLKNVLEECSVQAGLDAEKKIKNYSEIVYHSRYCNEESFKIVEELNDFIININISQTSTEETIFKITLYLEIIMTAIRYNKYNIKKLHNLVEKLLFIVEDIVTNSSNDTNYKTAKIMEAFINKVMLCMIENADVVWTNIDKDKTIRHLIMIIQRSNMKRPLSLSVEVLKRFGFNMHENELDKNYKIQFLDDTLKSLNESRGKSDMKIRRSPDSRLVIHAMCCSDTNPNKPLLKWALDYLIELISDPSATDSSVSAALHSIEILISDNSLQGPTLPFMSNIIVQCVELFARSSWNVRNADLQLTRAIIDRFYGVCLEICSRPKCVDDLFLLFPNVSLYFHGILSSEELDERAILVFQFFSESQIKEHFCSSETSIGDFLQLFMDILQKYPNDYGKMAARSYCALCTAKEIPNEICSVIRFITINFRFISKNILANFMFLIQRLYEKYKKSFEHTINKEGIKVINFAITDLLHHLKECETEIFDFILLKVKTRNEVLTELNQLGDDFRKRLWLHNNIPFLFINTEPEKICSALDKVLSNELPNCIQIKILTILISRFKNNEFDIELLNKIIQILYEKSISTDDNSNYLLNCYFKTILVFYPYSCNLSFKNKRYQFKNTSNIYKLMILVLYFSDRPGLVNDRQLFYALIESKYTNFMCFSDELRNDIISTVPYLQRDVPKEFRLKMLKLIFYSSLFYSTHLEAYKCITVISGKSYSSILSALADFFSVQSLSVHLKDKVLVAKFFNDVVKYVPEHVQQTQSEGYYSEESDILGWYYESLVKPTVDQPRIELTLATEKNTLSEVCEYKICSNIQGVNDEFGQTLMTCSTYYTVLIRLFPTEIQSVKSFKYFSYFWQLNNNCHLSETSAKPMVQPPVGIYDTDPKTWT